MATSVVQMDYTAIDKVSKQFTLSATVVRAVAKAVIAILDGLIAGTFFCPPLIAYYKNWQKLIQDKSTTLANKLDEIANDLQLAIAHHVAGDVLGRQYFMKGRTRV